MENKSLNQIIAARKEKIQKILDLGINPYPYNFKVKHSTDFIIKKNSGKKNFNCWKNYVIKKNG